MASPIKPILEGFMALRDNPSRRAVLDGIIDNLSSHEIREVKSRIKMMTFQCDLLDKLPLEMVAMVAGYLDLVDLIILQRVSKRWRQLLSSPVVLTAAIKCHVGKYVIKPGFTSSDLDALIRKRIRAERGLPAVVATFPNDLNGDFEDELGRDCMSLFNGVCAWIEKSTDRTTIFMVHLPTGTNRTLTTPNREQFTHLQVSDTLLSATSVRGYCHVWNMLTEEYKSFRIPSLQFAHYVSIGSKVMLSYVDSVVHICFESGITRSIKIGPPIIFLSAYAEEGGFSIICVRSKNPDIKPEDDSNGDTTLCWETHHLHIQKFSPRGNKLICTWEQYRELPFQEYDVWLFTFAVENKTRFDVRWRPGQSSSCLYYHHEHDFQTGPGYKYHSLSLSFDKDDEITVHLHLEESGFLHLHANLDYSTRGLGLNYWLNNDDRPREILLHIGYEIPELSHVSEITACRFRPTRSLVLPNNRPCTSILGDGDFVLLFCPNDRIWIWCFDETWLPSGIPNMRIATW
ncbi:unnamed protein product [Penicillium glandicola]